MRLLVLSADKQAELAALGKRAAANPVPLEVILAGAAPLGTTDLKLADRKPGLERPPSDNVLIPNGYRAAFSVEAQPRGLCNHLSVSVDDPGMLPSPAAVVLIAEACGMAIDFNDRKSAMIWLEEFDPGHHAVNIVTLRARRQ